MDKNKQIIKIKKLNFLLGASAMLVAMSFASCKTSNKPAETSRIGEIPEAAQGIVGIEKYDSLIESISRAKCISSTPAQI